MQLKIDTDECLKLNISPLEYLFLQLKYYNLDTQISFQHLIVNDFLNQEYALTNKGFKLFFEPADSDENFFRKAYEFYPHKTKEGRVLKSIKLDSGDGKYCLNKYKIYVKQDPNIGVKMFTGITNQVQLLNRTNEGIKYLQDIRTWFNQRSWERYCDLELEPEKPTEKAKRI